jgi:hypothetical protein
MEAGKPNPQVFFVTKIDVTVEVFLLVWGKLPPIP